MGDVMCCYRYDARSSEDGDMLCCCSVVEMGDLRCVVAVETGDMLPCYCRYDNVVETGEWVIWCIEPGQTQKILSWLETDDMLLCCCRYDRQGSGDR